MPALHDRADDLRAGCRGQLTEFFERILDTETGPPVSGDGSEDCALGGRLNEVKLATAGNGGSFCLAYEAASAGSGVQAARRFIASSIRSVGAVSEIRM